MTSQLALTLVFDSPLVGKVSNDRTNMVYPFFGLTKERVTELPAYDDGTVRIEVRGTELGVATMWDKRLLIYIASLIQGKVNRGELSESGSRRVTFTAHDFFRVNDTSPNEGAYDRLLEGLKRLKSTTVFTNIETGGEGEDSAFSWVSDYKLSYRRSEDGKTKTLKGISVELCPWLWRAIMLDNRMLTYHADFFRLGPIEQRLYEIARAHCGSQPGFRINIEKLRRKVGTQQELKHFKALLVKLAKQKDALPEYRLALVDPRNRAAADRKAPRPPGRTPLKGYMVWFYREDQPWTEMMKTPIDGYPEIDGTDLVTVGVA